MLVIWLVLRIPIAIVRRCYGWRLALAGDNTTGADEQHRRQFSLKYLFLCTALAAVIFGIARKLFTNVLTFDRSSGTELLKEIAGSLILISFNGLGGAVVIAGTLTPKKTLWRLAAAFVGCVSITGMEVLVIQWMAMGGDYEGLLWFNGIQFAIVALVLLTLRGCGVALVRFSGR